MQNRVLVPLAPGFEEIEAVTIIDVLRRADLDVVVARLDGEATAVPGAHGIAVETDTALASLQAADLRAIVLPGGLPGATNLREDERVLGLVRELHASGRLVAAICAAPIVLGAAGVLEGVRATSYPGFEDGLTGATLSEKRVEIDGAVITSRGPGTALEFALTLVGRLVGPEKADELSAAMLVLHR